MPQYRYQGKHLDGRISEGEARAASLEELETALVNKGIFVEDVVRSFEWWQKITLRLFKWGEVTRVTRQIGILLKSEIPIIEVLELALEQTSDNTFKDVLSDISRQVEKGKSVADAFARYPVFFDTLYVNMLQAGESSGDLDDAFEQVADYREKYEVYVFRQFGHL
jgi:type IV pilus assembly protein PilC